VATVLAMPSIPMLQAGEKWVGTSVGAYGSRVGIGVAAAYQASANLNVGMGVSTTDSGSAGIKAQVGYRW
jgi:hypothetical protein